ncbi:MAG: hypothetical protein MZV64_63815 [Ignavibacteriales bacterium]|nr:hypothetical protein [Ignavibacteriales bacterium]
MHNPSGLSRRDFARYLLAGSAVSLAALDKANAGLYQKVTELNQKFLEDEAPDGVYWEEIRKLYDFEDRFIMMNNGTLGPMPRTVFNTLTRYFRVQATNPYDGYNYPAGHPGVRPDEARRLRQRFARRSGHHQQHHRGPQFRHQRPGSRGGRRGPDVRPGAPRARRSLEAQGEADRHPDQGSPAQPDGPVGRRDRRRLRRRDHAPDARHQHQPHRLHHRADHAAQGAEPARPRQGAPHPGRQRPRHRHARSRHEGPRHRFLRFEPLQVARRADRGGPSLRPERGHRQGPPDRRLHRVGGQRQGLQARPLRAAVRRDALCPRRGPRLQQPDRKDPHRAPDQGPRLPAQAGAGQGPGRQGPHAPRPLPQRRADRLLDGRVPRGQARRLPPGEVQPGRPHDRQSEGRDFRHPGLDAHLHLDPGGRHGRRGGPDASRAQGLSAKKIYVFRPFFGPLQAGDLA